MEKEAKEAGIHIFLIRILTKGIHAWMHNLPPPEISQKSYPVHMLVREVYDDQNIIGWKHAMGGRVSQRWSEAQGLHNDTRNSKNRNQGHVVVQTMW